MKKAGIRWVTALILFGLIGVLIVQSVWISRAIQVNARSMDRAVAEALSKSAERLELLEDIDFLSSSETVNKYTLEINTIESGCDTIRVSQTNARPLQIIRKIKKEKFDTSVRQQLTYRIDSLRTEIENTSSAVAWADSNIPNEHIIYLTQDSLHQRVEERLLQIELRHDRIDSLLNKMIYTIHQKPLPWSERLNDSLLQYILSEEFLRMGLPLSYEYAVDAPDSSQGFVISSPSFVSTTGESYAVPIFKNDLITEPARLLIKFPGKASHLVRSMSLLIGLSLLFSLVLVFAALAGILTMYRQKKISQIKSDFINNISHEFRTPMATISLATDAIENEKILGSPESIRPYVNAIRQENRRMQDQVDKILQMALFDRNELIISTENLDIHSIIDTSVETMGLQARQAGGTLTFKAEATLSVCKIDRVHFFNTIINLIDNAIKYSPESPEVVVRTFNDENRVYIEVVDKGIGMDKATEQRIFERFYRVSTGNIHNVKGFGLGLSYVRAVVDALDGTIEVKSDIGKGSTFKLSFPLSHNRERDE